MWEISEEELHKMQETKFQPTSKESWKQLWLLLAKEFGDWVEDVLRFLTNIPSGVILLPRYLKYRVDINSSDEVTKTTWEIKIKELTSENTSLVLLDLLWEQWVELIKKLWEMLTSGKQWDIAMMMVTIAGLVALWWWATKLGLNLARKSSVKSARAAGRTARISGQTTSRATRNSLKTVSWVVWNFAKKAERIDDIIGWAGIGHLTGAYSSNKTEIKISKWEEKSYKDLNIWERKNIILEIFQKKWVIENEVLMKNIDYIVLNYENGLTDVLSDSSILDILSQKYIEDIYQKEIPPYYFFLYGKEISDSIENYGSFIKKFDINFFHVEILLNNPDKTWMEILQILENILNEKIKQRVQSDALMEIIKRDVKNNITLLIDNSYQLNQLDDFWIELLQFFYERIWVIHDTRVLSDFIDLYKKEIYNISHIDEVKIYLDTIWKWEFFHYFVGLNYFSNDKFQDIGKWFKVSHIKEIFDMWFFDQLNMNDPFLYQKIEYIFFSTYYWYSTDIQKQTSMEKITSTIKNDTIFSLKEQLWWYYGTFFLQNEKIISYLEANPESIQKLKDIWGLFQWDIPYYIWEILQNNIEKLDNIHECINRLIQFEKNNRYLLSNWIFDNKFTLNVIKNYLNDINIDIDIDIEKIYAMSFLPTIGHFIRGMEDFSSEKLSKLEKLHFIFTKYQSSHFEGETFWWIRYVKKWLLVAIQKIDIKNIFSIDLDKLDELLSITSQMRNLDVINNLDWDFHQIQQLMKSNDVKNKLEVIDTQIETYFSHKKQNAIMYLNILFSHFESFKNLNDVKANKLIDLFINPLQNIDELIKTVLYYNERKWLHTENEINFNKDWLVDALKADEQMAILNINFFQSKTYLNRSDFSSWQEYIIAEVKERSIQNKEKIVEQLYSLLGDKTISRQQFEQEQKQVLSTWGVTINTNQLLLSHILQDWEVKSMWEVKDSLNYYTFNRNHVESRLWIATDLHEKNMEHVVYWWMVTDESLVWMDLLWAAPWYNKWENIVFMKIKEHKKSDMLFVIDDSFSDLFSRLSGVSISVLHEAQVDIELAAYAKVLQNHNWKRNGEQSHWINYVETHIFNGVRIDDIEWIYFDKVEDYNDYLEKFPQYRDLFHLIWK